MNDPELLDLEKLGDYRVIDDDDDDPVLLHRDGTPVGTWRQSYPYPERMDRPTYERHKRLLQIELLKLQKWIKASGERLLVVFEGRDAAGIGGPAGISGARCRPKISWHNSDLHQVSDGRLSGHAITWSHRRTAAGRFDLAVR